MSGAGTCILSQRGLATSEVIGALAECGYTRDCITDIHVIHNGNKPEINDLSNGYYLPSAPGGWHYVLSSSPSSL